MLGAPQQIRAPRQVSAIEPIPSVQFVSHLHLGRDTRVFDEVDAGAGQFPYRGAVDVPGHPEREPSRRPQRQREVRVVDDVGAVQANRVGTDGGTGTSTLGPRKSGSYPVRSVSLALPFVDAVATLAVIGCTFQQADIVCRYFEHNRRRRWRHPRE